jgi:ACS family tartrate transporter-like MFS transporter
MAPTDPRNPVDVASRTTRRIAMRLLPFLFVLYIFNYAVRVNVGFAALQMTGELGFSNAVFGFGAGIFFIGYFLLQVPATMLLELSSARVFIGASLIAWGTLATLTGFISSATEFYWIRFFLGIAEAGFFPGVIVYLTYWFRQVDRAKAVAMFMAAIPASNMLGAIVAAALLRLDWFGMSGWRWLLIIEGFPSILAGVFAFFYLTDRPEQARWLADDERRWITTELAREKESKTAQAKLPALQALRQPTVLLLGLTYFCYITNSVGLGTWLPKIVQGISGLGTTEVSLIAAIPWAVAIPAMILNGFHSDRTGERRWHAALPLMLVGIGLFSSVLAGSNIALAIAAFSVATMALYAFPSPFWTLPTMFLAGPAAAASIAMINSLGNLGGFSGPYIVGYLTDKTGGYVAGLYYLMAAGLVGGIIVLSLRRSISTSAPIGPASLATPGPAAQLPTR